MKLLKLTLSFVVVCFAVPLQARITPIERQKIDKVLGMTGKYVSAEDTYKFKFLGVDARLMIQGREIAPLMGIESRAAFISDPHHCWSRNLPS